MNELHEKIKSALAEQDGNFIHIHNALEKLKPYLPIVSAHLDDRDVVGHIDQMIFRFMKIQDGMGRRLIPLIVEMIEADTSEMTFIDKLNRLEKFGLIEPGEWNSYRKIRNDLAHTYPEEKEELVGAINEATAIIQKLEASFLKMRHFCQKKLVLVAG
ncbi:MAG: hypothetical protein Q8P42_04095 [Gallionella sp.]|nr:hypothetical protein [Gallionella sp.]